jgi:putative flippase GtrA
MTAVASVFTNPSERNRFLKFLAVGFIGAVIDFGAMNTLSHSFNVSLVIAGTISFTCAIISNFLWNRFWTYPESRSRPLFRQLGMFFVVNVAGVVIRLPILKFLEPPLLRLFQQLNLKLGSITPEFLAKNGTLAIAVLLVMLWNFFVNRYWTYNDID